MDADGRNETDIFRYTDVEYTPDGHSEVYRWEDFLGIAGGHVYSAMDTIDMVSAGGEYDGDEPEYAYACEIVGCCGLRDGVALFRPVSHGGNDLIQIGEKAARGVDDVVQAVKAYRANAIRVDRKVIPGRIPERLFEGARTAAANTAGGADGGTGLHI